MKATSVFFGSFDRSLRILWVLVAAGGLGLVALYSWSPEVAPMLPGELSRPDLSRLMSDAADGDAGDEFVSRPLFVHGRRPLVAVTAPVAKVVKEQSSVAAKVLENVTLLGVFSSGESRGVIILESGVDRRRMLVGEQTGDWTLLSVEPRAAVFKSGSAESRVEMGLVAIGQRSGGITVSAQTQQDSNLPASEGDPEKTKAWVPTFENIRQRKLQNRSKPASELSAEVGAKNAVTDTEKRDEL